MKKLILLILSNILLLTLFSGCKEEDWEYLFNGKNLIGWNQLNGKAKFEVVDGEIVGTTVPNTSNSFLATDKTYSDFILELELFLNEEMNSGIQFRSESNPEYQKGRVHGYQCEVDPSDRAWSGGIYDEGRRGWLYPVELNPSAKSAFKLGQWNKYRIECIGNSMRTWLNGVPVAFLIDDLTPSGFIALQVHAIYRDEPEGTQIKWRNIRIKTKDLIPSPEIDSLFVVNLIPNNLSAQEAKQGFKLLFDGETTNGWASVSVGSFPQNEWKVNDGILSVIEAKGETEIETVEKFQSFELKFDFNLMKAAEGGIKYCIDNDGSVVGLEYPLVDNKIFEAEADSGGNHTLASLYDLITSNVPPYSVNFPGRWNRGHLMVSPDGSVEHWINGLKVVEYTRGDSIFKDLCSKSIFKNRENFGMSENSPVLLHGKSGTIQFRSIKIRTLF